MVIVLSYAFAHIIEAVILWMSMSQMYEHRYKKWVTGLIIMIGHAIMFMVFLSNNMAISIPFPSLGSSFLSKATP